MNIAVQIGDLATKFKHIASLSKVLCEVMELGGSAVEDYAGAAIILTDCLCDFSDELTALYNEATAAG